MELRGFLSLTVRLATNSVRLGACIATKRGLHAICSEEGRGDGGGGDGGGGDGGGGVEGSLVSLS